MHLYIQILGYLIETIMRDVNNEHIYCVSILSIIYIYMFYFILYDYNKLLKLYEAVYTVFVSLNSWYFFNFVFG